MTNKVQGQGTRIQYANGGADIVSGQPVLLGTGGLHGVAVQDIANGATGSVEIPPCFIVNMSVHGHNGSANANVAIYDKVYLTSGETFVDTDASATFFGYTLGAQTAGATTNKDVAVFPAIA